MIDSAEGGWNGIAVISFVLACVTVPLVMIPFIAPVTGVSAIVSGLVALWSFNQRRRLGLPHQKGRWMAVTGIVAGVLLMAVVALFLIAILMRPIL